MLNQIVLHAGEESPLRVEVLSFGFKRGIPREGDLVFDVRFLPNPFYIPELGHHTGLDQDVKDFVLGHPVTKEFLENAWTCSASCCPTTSTRASIGW